MRSTLSSEVSPYLGADLTDRYAAGCRDIDVCGLTPASDNLLHASFWHWQWDCAAHGSRCSMARKRLRGRAHPCVSVNANPLLLEKRQTTVPAIQGRLPVSSAPLWICSMRFGRTNFQLVDERRSWQGSTLTFSISAKM